MKKCSPEPKQPPRGGSFPCEICPFPSAVFLTSPHLQRRPVSQGTGQPGCRDVLGVLASAAPASRCPALLRLSLQPGGSDTPPSRVFLITAPVSSQAGHLSPRWLCDLMCRGAARHVDAVGRRIVGLPLPGLPSPTVPRPFPGRTSFHRHLQPVLKGSGRRDTFSLCGKPPWRGRTGQGGRRGAEPHPSPGLGFPGVDGLGLGRCRP